ncbi:MAG: KpsF/GutQ family sugar-phosphate isomerase [Candidatus Latescibacter sp.]|nr:KpsF/GutQ family sugar-phosphate isomerase [Candidatus Latescibacter sp.]
MAYPYWYKYYLKFIKSEVTEKVSREIAIEVLKTEAEAIIRLIDRIGPEFDRAEEILSRTKGRVIVSGLGKSGIIGRKIASTLASIGIPAFFIHPVEGAHGDIGMIMRGDSAIIISKSGSTDELNSMLNHLKRLGIPIIAITGNPVSNLAGISDVVLNTAVEREACPLNIVPTASTTAALALGDALAISLLNRKGLTADDFAVLHPGGTIGNKLTYRVKDLMICGDDLPLADINASMGEVIEVMSDKKLGIAVITEQGRLSGVITDGDLRRLLQRVPRPLEVDAREAMAHTSRDRSPRSDPLTIDPNAFAAAAVNLMEKHIVTTLVVTHSDRVPIGLIRWIDLSLAGVV